MSGLEARHAARGRALRDMPASAFLCAVPRDMLASLEESGYQLVPRTRPGVNCRGVVHVRLVWRGRERASVAMCFTLRGDLPDALLDALDEAMAPVITIDA